MMVCGLDRYQEYAYDVFSSGGSLRHGRPLTPDKQAHVRAIVPFADRLARASTLELESLVLAHGYFPPDVGSVIGATASSDLRPWTDMLRRWVGRLHAGSSAQMHGRACAHVRFDSRTGYCITKALSLKQSWTNLIACGEKTIETRTWKTEYRGPLLMVSSKIPPIEPAGMALAVAELVDRRPMSVLDEPEARCPKYAGAYAWVLKHIRRIRPFPVRGQPGLFEVELGNEYDAEE